MTQVLTLGPYTPPARYDELPWTDARIEEAATENGAYTELETLELDPVDDDPADPQSRSFTTELATVGSWYRIVWVDDDGDESDPTLPVENTAGEVEPFASVADIKRVLGQAVASTARDEDLERVLLAAAGEIVSEVGRTDFAGWELALAAEVNLERAVEHWQAANVPFGVLTTEFGPLPTARDSWVRHAHKLAPLKASWGLA